VRWVSSLHAQKYTGQKLNREKQEVERQLSRIMLEGICLEAADVEMKN
jgi:hypothetical protein